MLAWWWGDVIVFAFDEQHALGLLRKAKLNPKERFLQRIPPSTEIDISRFGIEAENPIMKARTWAKILRARVLKPMVNDG